MNKDQFDMLMLRMDIMQLGDECIDIMKQLEQFIIDSQKSKDKLCGSMAKLITAKYGLEKVWPHKAEEEILHELSKALMIKEERPKLSIVKVVKND